MNGTVRLITPKIQNVSLRPSSQTLELMRVKPLRSNWKIAIPTPALLFRRACLD